MAYAHLETAPVRVTTPRLGAARKWTGRVLTGFITLFLLFDAVVKLLRSPIAIEATLDLGYRQSAVFAIGAVLLLCLALHLVPRTALLGAVLLTGYLGGAVASQVRVGHPWATHVLTPIYVAGFIWVGLCLRDDRVRALLGLPGPKT